MNPSSADDSARTRPAEWGALAAILAAGAVARVFESGRAPMWFDEIYTTWAARGGAAHVVATLARDVHPPLHTLLVAAWAALGGEATAWLRSLSILFGLATIVVVYRLGQAMFGRSAGLAAAALLALHPVHVYFSQESRVYALLWLELAAAWWLGWRWLQGGRARHAVGYVVAATLALYSHYLAGLVLAFTGAFGLVVAARGPGAGRRALAWCGLHLVVAVLFAPQLPTFLAQQGRLGSEHWTLPPDARDLRDWLRRVAGGATWQVPVFAALGALAFWRRRDRRAAAFLALMTFAPVLVAWWISRLGAHVFTERYMDYVLPAAAVLVGGGLAAGAAMLRDRPAALRAAPWLVLAVLLAAEAGDVMRPRPLGEAASMAEVAERLRADVRPGDVVFCADTHALLFLEHYDRGLARFRLLWFAPRLPYYEGALVIPDSLVAGPSAFDEPRPPGSRRWGVRVRRGGSNGPAVAALFDSAAAGPARRFGEAMLWGPE